MYHSVRHARFAAAALFVLMALLAAVAVTPADAASGSSSQTDLRADLEGDKIDGVEPRGEARFVEQVDGDEIRRELEVKVQDVNLEAGTALDVAVDGVSVGTIELRDNNDGELRLRTDDGDEVRSIGEDDVVTVASPDGTVILSGAFEPH